MRSRDKQKASVSVNDVTLSEKFVDKKEIIELTKSFSATHHKIFNLRSKWQVVYFNNKTDVFKSFSLEKLSNMLRDFLR